MKAKKSNFKIWLIVLFLIVIILPLVWILLVKLESEKPSLILSPSLSSLGVSQEISFSVSDTKSGLRRIWAGLLKDGKEILLLERDFPALDLIRGGKVRKEKISIRIKPKELGINDGTSVLRMVVWDYSWRNWWHGNRTYIEKDIIIDTKSPDIEILSRVHNISQGGTGLVIYRVSEPCFEDGVFVGDNFFPGYFGYFKDKDIRMAFFALNYDQGPGTRILVKASDMAGNSTTAGFPYYIRKKKFKTDVINISDRFLNWKMPEFDTKNGIDSDISPIKKFIIVNRKIRRENFEKFVLIGEKSDNALHWRGSFLRLPKSKKMAGFADHREYKYKSGIIDRQVHLGVDLASVSHSPVPAANKGIVLYKGSIGIYGKTIVIDHGFGLFSIYSHLNSLDVQQDQMVSKGEIIGRTGVTGLAGGDHLHFGIMVHNTFVNPIEWWDETWIKNNISTKIEKVKREINE